MTVSGQRTAAEMAETGGLRVGVTLFVRDGAQSVWENGIFQNCLFLVMLLERSPVVTYACIVVSGPAADRSPAVVDGIPVAVVDMREALEALDVIIELSAQLDPEWGKSFAEKGGRIVGMRVANDFIIDAERMAFNLPPGLLMSGVPYHRIWTLPAFEPVCAGYYAVAFRAKVRVMQHLWSPFFIDKRARASDRSFRYSPGAKRWRIAILEPNICSVKTCHIPLLACDMAHRLRPDVVEIVRVFNAMTLKENPAFVSFARSTDLVRQGLASFESRYPLPDIMGPLADAIVSHHWENAQNYLYYEALYGGFPLVHNSDLLDECGYRYREFDPSDGGRALIQGFLEHDRNLEAYRSDASRFLARLDPIAEANVRSYSEEIVSLFDKEHDVVSRRSMAAGA